MAALLATIPFAAVVAQQPQAPAAPSTVAPGAVTPEPPPNTWIPRQVANLIALDKISARQTALAVRVGQSASFGSLTIAVRACAVRPADQAADASAYLDITDAHPNAPQFHGWMILSAPAVSMLEHPVYDIRLAGCQT